MREFQVKRQEQRALVAYNTFWNAMNRANSRSKQNSKLKLFKDLPSTKNEILVQHLYLPKRYMQGIVDVVSFLTGFFVASETGIPMSVTIPNCLYYLRVSLECNARKALTV